MAEGILSNVVGNILEVLGSQLLQEVQLAFGVQAETRELKGTFETINGVLLDAEKQFHKNEGVKAWLLRLQDVAYDAEDLLDDFYTQLKLKRIANEVRIFCSQSNQIAYSLKMGHKIKAIRERLDRVKSDEPFLFLIPHLNLGSENGVKRKTGSFVPEEDVIGREDDKKKILQLLLDSNDHVENTHDHVENNVSVISVIGIGGIGKTTLAQSVYNVEEVKTHFQLRLWVCVSDDFTLETVVVKILKSTETKEEIEKMEMDGLLKELGKQIDGNKYLLVLDDVWNKNRNKWRELRNLLRNGSRGSKILVPPLPPV